MIEKLNTSLAKEINAYSMTQNQVVAGIIIDKINELVDVVNDLQKDYDNVCIWVGEQKLKAPTDPYAKQRNWLGCLCRFWFDNKKQADIGILGDIDEDETHAENMPQPIKLYVCPDGSVYDNEDVAKSHAASMFNPLPAGATTTDRVYLEQELDRTKKQLEIAIDALKDNLSQANFTQMLDASRFHCIRTKCESALEQITALEQKDK